MDSREVREESRPPKRRSDKGHRRRRHGSRSRLLVELVVVPPPPEGKDLVFFFVLPICRQTAWLRSCINSVKMRNLRRAHCRLDGAVGSA